jgi:hypothetical protein
MAMADQRADEHAQQSGTAMKRRGILAAAAAVVGGIVAKLAEAPVLATSGGGDQGFLALGSNPWYTAGIPPGPNNAAISSAPTVIHASPNFGNFVGQNGADVVLFEVDARPSSGTVDAIYGFTDGSGYGVYGAGFYGVFGNGTSIGVYGSGTVTGVSGFGATGVSGSGSSIGVSGSGTSFGVSGVGATGVFGQSAGAGGIAVRGNIPTSAAANNIAVTARTPQRTQGAPRAPAASALMASP